jgi:hypothetical protein
MKTLTTITAAAAVACWAADARAQRACPNGGGPSSASTATLATGVPVLTATTSAALVQQAYAQELARQYALQARQQAYYARQLALERESLDFEREQASQRDAARQRKLEARRQRREAEVTRREAAKARRLEAAAAARLASSN